MREREIIINLASHIKVTHQGLPSKEDTLKVTQGKHFAKVNDLERYCVSKKRRSIPGNATNPTLS